MAKKTIQGATSGIMTFTTAQALNSVGVKPKRRPLTEKEKAARDRKALTDATGEKLVDREEKRKKKK